MHLKRIFTLFVFIQLIFLAGCVKNQVLDTRNSENPFAATGLLAHPNETAEEIFLRAHSMDSEAATLVLAGYLLGVGGFPKDEWLFAWYDYDSYPAEWYKTVIFLELMRHHLYATPVKFDPYYCHAANLSFATPLFKQAGLFDLDVMCADIGYDNKSPDHDIIKNDEHFDSLRKELVGLIAKPMTNEGAKKLAWLFSPQGQGLHNFIAYHIATGGNKKASTQEKQLNLLRFMALRKDEPFPESVKLYDVAADTLARLNSASVFRPVALEIIRKAHLGDPVAARQMAENYHNGDMGFPKNSFMATYWLERGALGGDKKALDNFALWSYARVLESDTSWAAESAWLNAHIAMRYGSLELRDVFSWIILETEKHFTAEELIRQQEVVNKEIKRLDTSGYQAK